MADLAKLVDELSALTVLEAAELSKMLEEKWGVSAAAPVAYLGDTVADVETVLRARAALPDQRLLSLAVAPPHLQVTGKEAARAAYEERLRQAGADRVLGHTGEVAAVMLKTIGGA